MKQALIKISLFISTALLLTALTVYLVDPFFHYHQPWLGLNAYLYNQVYQTPGAARNLPYDSLILGTSMTENFRASWFDKEMGWDTLKLSYAGARSDDLNAVMGQVFRDGRKVENVFMDINDYQLSSPPDSFLTLRPRHLYDRNPLSDIEYLWNKDVLWAAFTMIVTSITERTKLDESYLWGEVEFGKHLVYRSLEEVRRGFHESESVKLVSESLPEVDSIKASLDVCEQNLENIVSFIEENPDTRFIIYYPPYSMAYWQGVVERGLLAEKIAVYTFSIEYLLAYANVEIYYFQDIIDITGKLDNYLDLAHHRPEINYYIYASVRDGKHRLFTDTYKAKLSDMYLLARDYDYTSLWGEG
ncbi:MAG: hypothetical protein LBC96_00465 [Lachnospiraceae bacterium]|jgi:hypothetical protein|nr:hypothetical protein [Lachnospiraceae bacterium]